MGLVRQKSRVHEVIEQFNFCRFKEEMLAFCQRLFPVSAPFLMTVCCYVLSTRERLIVLKHTLYWTLLSMRKNTYEFNNKPLPVMTLTYVQPVHSYDTVDLLVKYMSLRVFCVFDLYMCSRLQNSLLIKDLPSKTTRQLDLMSKTNLAHPVIQK